MPSPNRLLSKLALFTALLSGCGFKVASTGDHDSFIISGLIPSLLGSSSIYGIANKVKASSCTNTASLFKIESDGSINESSALATSEITNGRYSFEVKSLGLTNDTATINYLVKAETCSGGTLKRPVTNFDSNQDIDAKSTVIAEVVNANSLTPRKLNESKKEEILALMSSLMGETTSTVLDSLTSNPTLSNQFQQIFGASSTILREAKPEVSLTTPFDLNESATSVYSISAFHIDPNYSFSYKWKLDGVVKSSAATWNYIPSPNDSGNHQIDVYIGMDNGSGGIDLSKPYYAKTITVIVNNNVLPVAPDIQINSGTPSPRNTNSIQVDLSTGVALANCSTFSHLAITDTNTIPGIMQFNIDCTSSGTQTENITFTNTDGAKTLYLWAIDNAGQISNAKSVNFVLDTTVPTAILSFAETNIKGGSSYTINLSGSDVGVGLDHLKLYFANDATTYSLVATVSNSATSYSWAAPTIDTIHGKLKFIATDLLGFTTTVYSNEFAIDSTAPSALSLARSTSSISNSTTVGINVTGCSGDAQKMLFAESNTVPTVNAAGWEDCAATKNFTVTGSDGLKTVYGFSKDEVGNISAVSTIAMTLDTTSPVVSTGPVIASFMAGGSSQNITWTTTDASTVTINLEYYDGSGWNSIVTGNSNSGTYSWSVPSLNTNTAKIRLIALDAGGNSTSITSSDFKIDSAAPVVTSLQFNSGNLLTNNNSIISSLQANDNLSEITQFCFKYNSSSQPSGSDLCWQNVNAPLPGITPSLNISFANYYYQVGLSIGNYNIYSWVKDAVGHISNNTNTLNVDRFVINFDPGTPPIISAAQVSNSDSPNQPIVESDLIVTSGSNVFIKWNTSDIEGLHATPIDLFYTTNDATFTLFSGGANLVNGANGGCTVTAGFTGCAVLTAPVSTYFKIRLVAKDLIGTTVFLNSVPFNNGKLSILAGNTETGLGGNARTALFSTYSVLNGADSASKNKLVVSEDGKVFYHDVRGLLWINPETAKLEIFIPITGISSGDGGSISSATLRNVQAISLTATNELLIWDHDRIRKVNLENLTISTLFGGGAQADPSGIVSANSISLSTGFHRISGSLITLPNGDVLFTSPVNSFKHRRYRAIDQQIVPMTTAGIGYTGNASGDWSMGYSTNTPYDLGIVYNTTSSEISFMAQGILVPQIGDSQTKHARINPASGSDSSPYTAEAPHNLPFTVSNLITGQDGKLYFIDRFKRSLRRYNPADNTSTLLLGTGSATDGMCANGTIATSCSSEIDTLFISKIGQIYFTDRGAIRTINESNQVITLFGQYYAEGNSSDARLARFGNITDLNFGKTLPGTKKISVLDTTADRYREFDINGNINSLAYVGFTWHGPWSFEVDQTDGDLLAPKQGSLQRYDRDSSAWSVVVGGGATSYFDNAANGQIGSSINIHPQYNNFTLGFVNNQLFYSKYYYTSGSVLGCYVRGYDSSDSYRQVAVMGGDGSCTNQILPGQTMDQQKVNSTVTMTKIRYFSDPADSMNKYFYAREGTNLIYKSVLSGAVSLFVTLNHNIYSFTHAVQSDGLNLYYCSTTNRLYKYVYNTAVTTELTWGSTSITCDGLARGILYDSERNSIIFIYRQNNLKGVAEFDLDP
jgi:hypothetical protein